jgi:hypothetical protein
MTGGRDPLPCGTSGDDVVVIADHHPMPDCSVTSVTFAPALDCESHIIRIPKSGARLPGSLPDELRKRGYELTEIGETERILPAATVQQFVAGRDGDLKPLITGSTRPVALTVTHAGICKVQRYGFTMR